MRDPVVTLLTDYGLADEFVGVCHGVILGICPEARIVDLSHGIEPGDITGGALTLASALPFLPVGVHIAIVDPGVGGSRRAVAVALADGRRLVGPDNGLLWPAVEAGGGAVEAVELSLSPLALEPMSATFHGRDLFAPVGAHLANGVALAEAGMTLDPKALVQLESPVAEVGDGRLTATVVGVDRFGNVQLGAGAAHVGALELRLGREVELRLDAGEIHVARFVRTFADAEPGELIVYEDSSRRLAVAFSQGRAAERLGLHRGQRVVVSRKA